jgi:hypothetical protein
LSFEKRNPDADRVLLTGRPHCGERQREFSADPA